eukprot:m.138622 g.138622  ORF g.138622 m.138622 type:complete len:478 (+) comp17035_c0_seq4:2397-3830(+)
MASGWPLYDQVVEQLAYWTSAEPWQPSLEIGSEAWWDMVHEASEATLQCASAWGRVFWPMVIISIAFFRENPEVALVLGIAFALYLLQRHVRRARYVERTFAAVDRTTAALRGRYNRCLDWVRTKSRLVASVLPHVGYLASTLCVYFLWPRAALYISTPKSLFATAVAVPTLATAYRLTKVLRRPPTAAVERAGPAGTAAAAAAAAPPATGGTVTSSATLAYWLSVWCVLGVGCVLLELPFVERVLCVVPAWSFTLVVFCVWLWLPIAHGASLVCSVIAPTVGRYFGQIPQSWEQQNMVLNVLVTVRVISDATRRRILEFLDGGLVAVLALPFVVTPGFLTHYGCALVGLAYPVANSLAALSALRPELLRRWCTYWVVFAAITVAHELLEPVFGFLPLWHHAELAYTVWLQLPYFRGADRVFATLMTTRKGTSVRGSDADGRPKSSSGGGQREGGAGPGSDAVSNDEGHDTQPKKER